MISRPSDDEILAAIDARSLELIDEMKRYAADCREERPDADARDLFEGWAIQKLAGLQVLLELLNAQLGAETERRIREGFQNSHRISGSDR